MNRVESSTDTELSQEEKDEIGLLVSKKILDPTVWTVEIFSDSRLLRVYQRAVRDQQGEWFDFGFDTVFGMRGLLCFFRLLLAVYLRLCICRFCTSPVFSPAPIR
jgi:hypothetical protein